MVLKPKYIWKKRSLISEAPHRNEANNLILLEHQYSPPLVFSSLCRTPHFSIRKLTSVCGIAHRTQPFRTGIYNMRAARTDAVQQSGFRTVFFIWFHFAREGKWHRWEEKNNHHHNNNNTFLLQLRHKCLNVEKHDYFSDRYALCKCLNPLKSNHFCHITKKNANIVCTVICGRNTRANIIPSPTNQRQQRQRQQKLIKVIHYQNCPKQINVYDIVISQATVKVTWLK